MLDELQSQIRLHRGVSRDEGKEEREGQQELPCLAAGSLTHSAAVGTPRLGLHTSLVLQTQHVPSHVSSGPAVALSGLISSETGTFTLPASHLF